MSIGKVGGSGAGDYDPIPAGSDQTAATVTPGKQSVADAANQPALDTPTITEQSQTLTSARDVATGQATGKRSHQPLRSTAEDAPRYFGDDIRLSAAHLPQLQGGASSTTPAADKSAKYEHSRNFSKVAEEVAWKQDAWKQETLSKDSKVLIDGKDPRIPFGVKDPRIPFDASHDALQQVQGGARQVADTIAGKIRDVKKDEKTLHVADKQIPITQDVTVNKIKTADKDYPQMDSSIKL